MYKLERAATQVSLPLIQFVAQPSGVIENVIYPVVSQQTLKDLVKEYKSTGIAYRQRV